ncbi:MAG: TRAP transporter large permease subunit [Candidatus Firestonebacteria bacterium]|nr:TRAP transporter large permease subunit [Candidatus Firestonebacteria bacterium]
MRLFLGKLRKYYHKIENGFAMALLFAMALIPVIEMVFRKLLNTGIAGSIVYVQHLTLWVGFVGAIIATRDKRHLTITSLDEYLPETGKKVAEIFRNFMSTAICFALFLASVQLVRSESITGNLAIPTWIMELILPIGFIIMALRFAFGYPKTLTGKILSGLAFPIVLIFNTWLFPAMPYLTLPFALLIIIAIVFGAPIFIGLGGLAVIFYFGAGEPVASIPAETYRIVTDSILPTIPLFTLTGYILAEGGASKRMVKVFNSWFGWMPGGLAIATIMVCTFFTTFTGASGVTILALGGLLLPVLLKSGYEKKFSVGLLTATGSIGLLFPPSLPLILYGISAGISILDLFKGGILPGLLLVFVVIVFSIIQGVKAKVARIPFNLKDALASLWETKWELLIPVLILYGIFGGWTSLVEAAAFVAIYAFIVEIFIYKDISLTKDLPKILLKCVILVGGVLVIIGVAMGFTSYIVLQQIPEVIRNWVAAHISSPLLFLLVLNLVLLVVGCLMDIFSAIIVVVPLILPIAKHFGIDPVHLGIIFIANLELGYLTPPVGMNLFLSAYRFEMSVGEVTKASVKFLLLMLLAVLIITYVPALTTYMVKLL